MTIDELKRLQNDFIQKRKKIIKRRKVEMIILLIVSIILGILLFIRQGILSTIISICIILFLSFIIFFILCLFSSQNNNQIKTFKKEYKRIFVLSSLEKIFSDVIYDPKNGLDKEILYSTKIINTGDSFYSNDYISGKYRNISFEQSDVHIEEEYEETDSEGNTHKEWRTIFKGRWMIFDFNKSFKTAIQVSNIGLGHLSNHISMEDEEFNKMFYISAIDEHDAFYILTPHFMESMKEITKRLNCGIMFTFIDQKLHIAINNYKDAFEPNVYEAIDENKIEQNILNDIKLITNFIDELDLDNDLFRREV